MSMTKFIEVITTFETADGAREMADSILKQKLGACCSIEEVESIYNWEGGIETSEEFQLTIKTVESHYAKLEKLILKNHSYETPQIISLPIIGGSDDYLKWIEEETK